MIKRATKFRTDDEWVTANFEQLIDTHPGEFLVLMEQEPFIGRDAKKLFQRARRKYPKNKYPKSIPLCMPIPRPEDFTAIL